jgi:hypothetical protein
MADREPVGIIVDGVDIGAQIGIAVVGDHGELSSTDRRGEGLLGKLVRAGRVEADEEPRRRLVGQLRGQQEILDRLPIGPAIVLLKRRAGVTLGLAMHPQDIGGRQMAIGEFLQLLPKQLVKIAARGPADHIGAASTFRSDDDLIIGADGNQPVGKRNPCATAVTVAAQQRILGDVATAFVEVDDTRSESRSRHGAGGVRGVALPGRDHHHGALGPGRTSHLGLVGRGIDTVEGQQLRHLSCRGWRQCNGLECVDALNHIIEPARHRQLAASYGRGQPPLGRSGSPDKPRFSSRNGIQALMMLVAHGVEDDGAKHHRSQGNDPVGEGAGGFALHERQNDLDAENADRTNEPAGGHKAPA